LVEEVTDSLPVLTDEGEPDFRVILVCDAVVYFIFEVFEGDLVIGDDEGCHDPEEQGVAAGLGGIDPLAAEHFGFAF
jgi:hypothetical protein